MFEFAAIVLAAIVANLLTPTIKAFVALCRTIFQASIHLVRFNTKIYW